MWQCDENCSTLRRHWLLLDVFIHARKYDNQAIPKWLSKLFMIKRAKNVTRRWGFDYASIGEWNAQQEKNSKECCLPIELHREHSYRSFNLRTAMSTKIPYSFSQRHCVELVVGLYPNMHIIEDSLAEAPDVGAWRTYLCTTKWITSQRLHSCHIN